MTSARQEPSSAGTSNVAYHPAARIAAAISSLSMWCSHDSFDSSHDGGRPGSWQKNRTPYRETLGCRLQVHSGQASGMRGRTLWTRLQSNPPPRSGRVA